MRQLHIYPTSRALRVVKQGFKTEDALLPTLMRMDEFEQRSILLEDTTIIDPLYRRLILKKAADFKEFVKLNLDLSIVKFFTKSDAIFKFFEELAYESVALEDLANADAYAEFEEHLEILDRLWRNYKFILDSQGFTDRAFISHNYRLNEGFIKSFDSIELYLEGYLSRFELDLLIKVSEFASINIHYHTSTFNIKMQQRFQEYSIELPNNSYCYFSLDQKKLLNEEPNRNRLQADIYAVEERLEQISAALLQIDKMVKSGISPENIALVLPDESLKEHFMLFDKHNNLNFAMGYDYSNSRIYKSLEALYGYLQGRDEASRKLLERYGFEEETLDKLASAKKIKVSDFFELIGGLGLAPKSLGELGDHDPLSSTANHNHQPPLPTLPQSGSEDINEKSSDKIEDRYHNFVKIFSDHTMSLQEWLFLWLRVLDEITIDDVRGGLVTVLGVLETRGVQFDGVVIVDFNEGVVPASSSKDMFLNSQVRAFAGLPTKHDRESLQKQYYKRLLEQAKKSVIIYSTSDSKLPSKFIYELGLGDALQLKPQPDILYSQTPLLIDQQVPVVNSFDASTITWSASRLKSFLDCRRRYYYRYIQKIEPKRDEELNEGAFLHHLLHKLFEDRDSFDTVEQMQKEIDILMDDLLPTDDPKASYSKLLWKNKLKDFVDRQISHFDSGWRVVECEKEFAGEIAGLKFKGRIDRLDQNATHTLVLDYKTGSTKEAQKSKKIETLNDLQMSIYHQILQPKYQNINLAFVKLFEGGEIEEITALEEKNERLSEVIVELKQTKSFAAEKTDDLQRCRWCEFALMCGRGEYL